MKKRTLSHIVLALKWQVTVKFTIARCETFVHVRDKVVKNDLAIGHSSIVFVFRYLAEQRANKAQQHNKS